MKFQLYLKNFSLKSMSNYKIVDSVKLKYRIVLKNHAKSPQSQITKKNASYPHDFLFYSIQTKLESKLSFVMFISAIIFISVWTTISQEHQRRLEPVENKITTPFSRSTRQRCMSKKDKQGNKIEKYNIPVLQLV